MNATALNSTSIYVSWEEVPLVHQNGLIRGHKVKYRTAGSGSEFTYIDIDNSTVMETVLTNLRKYVQYEIEVLAYTRVGDGVPHRPGIIIRTHEDGNEMFTGSLTKKCKQISCQVWKKGMQLLRCRLLCP